MNILITDDHALLRDGLKLLLEPLAEDINIHEADSLDEALILCATEQEVDLVLLELDAPGVNGIAGVRALRQRRPDVPIVALGASQRRDDVLAVLEAGANGYIPRTASGKLMLSALRLVVAGEIYIPSMLLTDRSPAEATSADPFGPDFRGPLARLTARQREVLLLLARGSTNAEIAETMGIEVNTAKNHIKAILKTLGARNRTQAVVEAVRLGMRPPAASPP
jgi:DNA-binding NarL/FixJ family response regulator